MNTYLLVGVLRDGTTKFLLTTQAAAIEEAAGKLKGRVEKVSRKDSNWFFPEMEWGAFVADQTGKVLVEAVSAAVPEAAAAIPEAGPDAATRAEIEHDFIRTSFALVLLGRILNV